MGEFHISMDVTVKECSTNFKLTVVYGPTRHNAKLRFLEELRLAKPTAATRWLILGDFNLICKASDRNNRNLNHGLMRQFREALNECDLTAPPKQEIHLE
jgi:exonuclease III